MRYKYCPECGRALIDKKAGDDGNIPYCEQCERFWFDYFGSCVIVLVANEYNEIALLQQNYMSTEYMSFVSGYICPGENAEETAMREVEEEIGIKLECLEYAGTHWFAKKDLLMHGFIGYAKRKEFVLSNEVDNAIWVPALDIVDKIFPEKPGNAMFALYRQYLEKAGLVKS